MLSAIHGTSQTSESDSVRASRASRDFEALLLGSLLRSMQKSFSLLPGDGEKPAGFDDYQYMATQAIASALSDSGGLGLSRLIIRQLLGNQS